MNDFDNAKSPYEIFNGWAYTENDMSKSESNKKAYDWLCDKYTVERKRQTFSIMNVQENSTNECYENADVLIERNGGGYATAKYRILVNKPNLSVDELALLCDHGNLCFGYRGNKKEIFIYTD